uniref:Uncharacterized protein n=1 Tax=Cynoglossus semilaevis TaxID=244447 RepID=A0A3P8VT04_CYNSE
MQTLLFSVQSALQDEFCKFTSIAARLYVQKKMLIYTQQVSAQRVRPDIQVLCALQRETRSGSGRFRDVEINSGPRETGRVVVNVGNFDLNPVKLQGVFYDYLQVERAGQPLLTQFLSIDSFIHEQNAVFQIHLDILLLRARDYSKSTRGEFIQIQAQVLRDVANERAMLELLRD